MLKIEVPHKNSGREPFLTLVYPSVGPIRLEVALGRDESPMWLPDTVNLKLLGAVTFQGDLRGEDERHHRTCFSG